MSRDTSDWSSDYLADIRDAFAAQRRAAERALGQLSDDELFSSAGAEDNSVAVLMKHVGGNLRSRWTRPFDTDGEKPDRERDSEFVVENDTSDSVRAVWDRGWRVLEETLEVCGPDDVVRTVRIRNEPMPLFRALHRSLAHTAQHVGQIIMLAKQHRGADWQTLSIPRGESARYLERPPG